MSMFTNTYADAETEANDYIEAVLALLGDREPLEVLNQLPAALSALTEGVSGKALRTAEAKGKWSMLEVLAHLADSELVWGYRLRMVLAEADPVLTGYDQDRWAKYLHYQERDVTGTLEEIRFLRSRNLDLLSKLAEDELERSGRHSERGEETVRHMVRLYAGHDLVHCQQLARIREKVLGEDT